MNPSATDHGLDESIGARDVSPTDHESMFQQLFERSADAIFLFDPGREVFVDCNQAAVEMMRATSKEQLLLVHPADLSSEFQPDGMSSREKTSEVINVALSKGSHRFEWRARRMDATELPLEVLLTTLQPGDHPLMATVCRDITKRKAAEAALRESEQKFRELFEASSDGIQILDPQERRIIDCNAATLKMVGCTDKDWFLKQPVDGLSPERQPDGRSSRDVGRAWMERSILHGPQRFEWVGRRFTGEEFPMEVLLTAVHLGGRRMMVSVSRDISERKKAERELLELNQSLERRVEERTAALTTSEAQLRALVEHAPEAIVVFNGEDGQFLYGNEHACALYGVTMDKLATLTPAEVSPEFQPDGQRSSELAREKMEEALAGGTPVFEWIHQQPDGRLVPTEVRLLRLPAECDNLIRASITDNTERKLAERALRESEAKFRALFEGASQGVVLHDEERILQVNPAAVRILGRQSSDEVVGKHPGAFAPPTQTNGESSDALARKHIDDCITNGSARFDWLACAPDGREIPMEVMLTRIEWSGRQIIQAFITDISERKRAQAALAESEALFSAAFQASPILIVIARMSDQKYVLVNDAFVNWSGCAREELLGRDSREFGIWESQEARDAAWADLRRDGSIHERECRLRNRRGDSTTMLISFEVIQINHAPHVLAMGLDITGRKQAEEASRASEARLRESEARFSAAFHASPALIGILRVSDGQYVLANDAHLNWLGYPRQEVLGRTCLELGMWENPNDRDLLLNDMHAFGSVRQKECRWRNRPGERFTVLLSAETIKLNDTPHMLFMAVDITQRKRSEEELRESEARLRESEARFSAAFQASPFFISILRMEDGAYVLANDAFVNWLGCSREEIMGRTSAELGMWENPEERASALSDMRTIGSIRQREVRWRNHRGWHLTILLSAETIRLNDVPHILSFAQDITQRKRAEEELRGSEARVRESEARFSAAFRASPVFMTISRMDDGRFTLANEAYLKWTGYRMDEILGRNSEELSLWADPADRAPFWEELRRAGSIHERECRVRSRHGQIFTMLISADIIEVNREPHLLTVGLDISQRKQAEAELRASEARVRESEARFSAAFHASPIITGITCASDGRFVLVNDASVNWSGYSCEEILGHTSTELGLWDSAAERERFWADIRRSGSIRARECRLRNRSGRVATMLASGAIIEINGEDHLLIMMVEISQRKAAEAELQRTLARERELSQLKSNFVSMVSHEFRTPLGIIQSSAELLRDFHQRMQSEEREDQLGSIIRNTRRMAGMMEEVLVLSRLDAGKLDFQPAALDLNIFCRRVVDEVLSATNRLCPIELSLNTVLPGAQADERLLGHIFTNLLSNAVKYSEPGAAVRFAVEQDGHDAVCVVRDFGIGIAEEDQAQLFKAFHRGSNVGTRPGTGLGLLLVRRCAELHGGKVQLDSKIHEGTTVTVRLPVFGTTHEKNTGH